MKSDKKISLTASANDLSVTVLSESLPQIAVNRPFTKEEALLRLKKCGGTVFSFGDADICIDDGLSVSAAEMNALRREALLRLADRLKERAPYRINKANIIFKIASRIKSRRRIFRSAIHPPFPKMWNVISFLFRCLQSRSFLKSIPQVQFCRGVYSVILTRL